MKVASVALFHAQIWCSPEWVNSPDALPSRIPEHAGHCFQRVPPADTAARVCVRAFSFSMHSAPRKGCHMTAHS